MEEFVQYAPAICGQVVHDVDGGLVLNCERPQAVELTIYEGEELMATWRLCSRHGKAVVLFEAVQGHDVVMRGLS